MGSFYSNDDSNIQSSLIDFQYKSIFFDIPSSKSFSDYNDTLFDSSLYEGTIIDEYDTNIELFLPKSILIEIDNVF